MANIYEFEVNRQVVEELVKDTGLSLSEGTMGDIVNNLLSIIDKPTVFQKALVGGKPGYCLRVGQVRTERFNGEGLHVFTHSGSEGYLDILEFDRNLKSSLSRQGIIYKEHTLKFF